QYAMQVIFSFLMVSMVFIMLPRATVAASRVAQVLELKPTVTDPPQPQSWPEGARGEVEFRDVSYAFPNATSPVLNSISFVARPGQTTAVIGSTGSGKSTLVNLIPRFFDVTAGQILIDGVDIRQVRQSDLHDRLGYVPQKGSLFSGQVLSNLRYGAPQAGLDQVQKAAEIAQAEEFIKLMPQKYASPIAQGGANVSGGQRQRLAIARALVKDADILIFDDSFSALDFQTDSNLRADLKKHLHDKTILIVAQRINTVVDADLIIVLDNGQIVGQGNHQELLGTCQVYREIAQSQLSDEELGHKVKN
ncbi:MAG TPA: ABC transporter ATP-binding protein, partial [Candidatus Wirthbacteria bacterium]|nr:ABC transporter ATP-binding protein [Candidatus Wirthbacteria bacterium]